MQLSSISPAISFQGQGQKKQTAPNQQESPIHFGSDKKTPLAIVALIASTLYMPSASAYVSDQHLTETNSAPPISRNGILINASFILLFVSIMAILSKTLGFSKDEEKALDNEAFFQALEKDPELQKAVKTLFDSISPIMLPSLASPDPSSARRTLEETATLKNILKTANEINKLMSQDQSVQVAFASLEVEKANLNPREAFAEYKEALGTDFNWKPVEELINAFIANPSGDFLNSHKK